MKVVIVIILIAAGIWYFNSQSSGGVDSDNIDKQVKKIASSNKAKPDKKVTTSDIQTLSNALSRTEDDRSKAYIIRLMSLAMLAKKDVQSFLLLRQKMERDHPDEDFFDFMDDDFPGVCSRCEGNGASKCTKCKGSGKCSNHMCKGGKISYEAFEGKVETKNCIICKGKAMCKTCEGSGTVNIPCTLCKGAGQKGVTAAKAEKLYKEALSVVE